MRFISELGVVLAIAAMVIARARRKSALHRGLEDWTKEYRRLRAAIVRGRNG